MINPTHQEIIDAQLARQWAEWNKSCEVSSPEIQAAANFILAHTTPPTMAEIEWDDDEHYLAEAERVDGAKVAMLKPMRLYPQIKCLAFDGGDFCIDYPDPDDLIPTGKRYTLTEVQE